MRDPQSFREALLGIPPHDRDAWLDALLGLSELPDDGRDLPRGCVPYLPCPVDALLRVVDLVPVRSHDVFVDVGSGLGRAAVLVHLLTGARAVGIEIQAELVLAAQRLVNRLHLSHVSFVHGDAGTLSAIADIGTVFFLYCPFSGDRLANTLAVLKVAARAREICICTIDLPLPACPWLTEEATATPGSVAIYRSRRDG